MAEAGRAPPEPGPLARPDRVRRGGCGGGGGGMWLDGFQWEKTHVRSSEWRIQEVVDSGADTLVVACPYEKPRFLDAVKNVPGAQHVKVLDLSEIILESIGD